VPALLSALSAEPPGYLGTMIVASALNESLLDLALQRNLAGFQQALKRTLEQAGLTAWAIIFPPTNVVGSRPLFMAQGIQSQTSPMLTTASKEGLEAIFPSTGFEAQRLSVFAREVSPDDSRYRILRLKRDKGGELILFCFRPTTGGDFANSEIELLSRVAAIADRCFIALTFAQEQEFEAGLFRMIGNLHPEGLCVLDNRLRVVFENRKFREQMHIWNHGLEALQNLTLPKQSELPDAWREACNRSFQAFQEIKVPPSSGRMAVTQGSLSMLRHPLDKENWIEGAVRYISFQSAIGMRPYLLLTCAYRQKHIDSSAVTLERVAEKHGFSRREMELANLILQGCSAREISARLKIAMPTVKTHIGHILHKAGVKTRLQFVGLCRPSE
jgi:DNA-binding CsgD family transcriptional regulator